LATYSTPIPGVPQYGQAALAAKTAYANTLARINQRRQSLLRQSGFAGEIDGESGVLKNMRVDGGNRYGALQLLNRSQAMRDEAARFQGVERGLGAGGGLAAQLRNQVRFDFGNEDSGLAEALLENLSSVQDEQNTAAYQRDAALYQAELEAARLAIQNQQFNQADFSGLEGTPQQQAAAAAATAASVPAPTSSKAKAPWEKALAARSAALNAKYRLGGGGGGRSVVM